MGVATIALGEHHGGAPCAVYRVPARQAVALVERLLLGSSLHERQGPMKRALQIILAISLFGVAFSGVLSYREVFGQAAAVCPSPGAAGTVFGYPACVYGFFMYVIVAGTAAAGLMVARRARNRSDRRDALAKPESTIGGGRLREEPRTT
jgi:hypothetical protein